MAPHKEDTHLSKTIIALSGYLADKFPSSRALKNIARSTDFKRFLFCLSEVAPSLMKGPLKRASRKCEHALRGEEKARTARKRVGPPDNEGRSTKRAKTSHTSQREIKSDVVTQKTTTQQSLWNGEVKDDEEPNPRTEKEVHNATSPENEHSRAESLFHGQQADAVPFLPSKYQVEIGLVRKTPIIEAYVRGALRNLKPTNRPCCDVDGETTEILMVASFLEFFRNKRELQYHLESREKMPGENLQAHITWDTSNPSKILDALEDVMRNTIDNKIHRAYGQTVLFSSVNAQVAKGYGSTATGRRNHITILEELAHKRAGTVSAREIEQMASRYLKDYYAGQKWLAVIEWFGGSGIVLIFVIAEIGSHYVERKWTDYQRECLRYLAGYLGSIKSLVEVLGSDALEIYCRNGSMGSNCVDRVKMVQFTNTDDEDGEEEHEHGDEDEGEDQVGVEIKTEEEEGQGFQNDDGSDTEDGDGDDDTDTDTDVDGEERALPEDDSVIEDEDEDEDEDDEEGEGDESN